MRVMWHTIAERAHTSHTLIHSSASEDHTVAPDKTPLFVYVAAGWARHKGQQILRLYFIEKASRYLILNIHSVGFLARPHSAACANAAPTRIDIHADTDLHTHTNGGCPVQPCPAMLTRIPHTASPTYSTHTHTLKLRSRAQRIPQTHTNTHSVWWWCTYSRSGSRDGRATVMIV